tara:strand:- start:1512 stop:2855 length:1344 start_codon:yes stop_codon:yes gene_type:complete
MPIDATSDIIFIDSNSFTYYKAGENVGIKASLNDKGGIYISIFDSQVDADQPRAPKGLARKRLCDVIDYFVDKSLIIKSAEIGLRPGNIGGQEGSIHNQTKLEQMYKNMGFTKAKNGAYTMSISNFMKWCETKYGKEILEEIAAAPKPKKEKAIKKQSNSTNFNQRFKTIVNEIRADKSINPNVILDKLVKSYAAYIKRGNVHYGNGDEQLKIGFFNDKPRTQLLFYVSVKDNEGSYTPLEVIVKGYNGNIENNDKIVFEPEPKKTKKTEIKKQKTKKSEIKKVDNNIKMSNLTVQQILKTHPLKNLRGILSGVRKEILAFAGLSANHVRKGKPEMIRDIVHLMEKGLITKVPPVYVKPKRETVMERRARIKATETPEEKKARVAKSMASSQAKTNRLLKQGAVIMAAQKKAAAAAPKAKKPRTEKQKAADKKLGEAARARAAAKKA